MRIAWVLAVCCFAPFMRGAADDTAQLRAYFIDVEGGQSTLIVAPGNHALLIDAGWDSRGRDAERIVRTARAAGVTRLDALFVTHFHRDHAGGVADLLPRISVGEVIDHGSDIVPYPGSPEIMRAYGNAIKGIEHKTARPGDQFRFGELRVFVLAASGRDIHHSLPGVHARSSRCEDASQQALERSENQQSLAVLVQFGGFRFLDDGDLLWNAEQALVCPQNLLGRIDALLLSHHGEDTATPPALVRATRPLAAIMNNGEKKGGSSATAATLAAGKVELWQIHYAAAMSTDNAPEERIANTRGQCQANAIELTADRNGNFAVINGRNGYRRQYGRRADVQ